MSGYDASIRVNTKVENSDLGKLQKDFDKLEKKLDSLYKKGDKLEALGVDKQSRQWKSLQYDVAQTEMELEDVADRIKEINRLSAQKVNENLGKASEAGKKLSGNLNDPKMSEGMEKATKSSKKLFKAIKDGTKKSNGLLATMGSRLKGIALSLLIFNWITKGFNAMVQAMRAGFQNLAQYSSDYNKAMSELKSQAAQLKNGLAASLEPIVNTLIPYLSQMVSWLNRATEAMGQFLAALQGKSVYTKAKKQVVDYAKSLNGASKAAKGALASFDQLNVLNSKEDSGGAGGEKVGADAFETAGVSKQIANLAKKVKAVIKPFKDSAITWFQGIDFTPLLDSLNRLREACMPFVDYIYTGLLWLFENVLQPLGSWTIEEALPEFIDMLAAGMSFLDQVLVTLRPTFDYIWNNILIPIGSFTGDILLQAIDMIKEAFIGLAALLGEKGDEINYILESVGKVFKLLWAGAIKPTFQFITGGLRTLLQYIVNVVGNVIDALAGIIDFIKGVFTRDWEKAWNGLTNVFKGIINGIIGLYEGIVNAIIDGLNHISIDVPQWVTDMTGMKKFGFNLARLNLPRLAEGAVIQGGRPFAAILGDQRVGQTNIETPLATMVDAFKQAMSESGNGSGGNYTFVAQLDGRTIFKETIRQEQMYFDATGESAFQH